MAGIEWLHRGALPRQSAGGKGASLSRLMAAGFAVPAGFAVNADAYRRFAEGCGLDRAVAPLLAAPPGHAAVAAEASERLEAMIHAAPLPAGLVAQIGEAYDALSAMAGLACAVRSSAVSEDSGSASFAGLYESYLNLHGITAVVAAVKGCYASLWSQRAIVYRVGRGRAAPDEAMAVVVMGLVPCDTAGIAFTAHPVTGARDQVLINASWGLGEAIVSGRVTPDSFLVEKGSLLLLERDIFRKEVAVYPHPDGEGTIERPLPAAKAAAPSLSDDEAREVARVACAVEAAYGAPQDVEWGLAGGQLYLLQSRPITTL